MEIFIGKILAFSFTVLGLSHLLQPKAWSTFFRAVLDSGNGALGIGMFSLPIGLVIIVFHNIWIRDIPVIITLFGWMITIKSVMYLLFPRSIERVTPQKFTNEFLFAGALLFGMGILLLFHYFVR